MPDRAHCVNALTIPSSDRGERPGIHSHCRWNRGGEHIALLTRFDEVSLRNSAIQGPFQSERLA